MSKNEFEPFEFQPAVRIQMRKLCSIVQTTRIPRNSSYIELYAKFEETKTQWKLKIRHSSRSKGKNCALSSPSLTVDVRGRYLRGDIERALQVKRPVIERRTTRRYNGLQIYAIPATWGAGPLTCKLFIVYEYVRLTRTRLSWDRPTLYRCIILCVITFGVLCRLEFLSSRENQEFASRKRDRFAITASNRRNS